MRDANNTMIQELSRKIDSLETELKTKKEKSVEEKADEISKDRPEYYEKYAKESHTDLYEQYKTYQNTPNELKRLDTEFAERLILDNPWERKILFSEKWTHWSIKERAENSFKLLSKVEKYKWNIKLVQKTLNWENVFVIELIPEIGKLTNLKNQVIAQEGIIRWKESELSKMQKKWDGLETIDESTTMFRSQESAKEVGKAETANNTNLNTKQNQIGQNMEQWEQIGNENLLETQIDYQKKQIESNNKKIEALEQKKSNGEELSQNEEKQLELLKRANDALTLDIQSVNQWEGKFYNASAQVDLLFQKAQTGEIPYKDIKLDWVSKSMFEANVFLQGMKKWISTLNLQTPIEFIKKISHSLEAIKVKFGDRISTQWKKLMEFYSKQLKLIEAKKQQARELQEKQARELQENKDRGLQENKDRELQENKDRELQEKQARELQENKDRELQENKDRELQEKQARELQENKDRENSSKEYNDQNPDNFYSKKISKEELLEIHKAQKTEKAEIYLKEWLAPENTIYLPNWEKIYVTDKCTGYGRFQLVWYAIENWKINIRLFYRSSSEWCWRSSWWLRSDGALSKGEFIPNSSYETTTKVDHRLWDIFDKLNSSKWNKNWTGIESPWRGNSRQLNVETLKKGMLESIKIESVLFPELPKDAVLFYYKKISQHVINWYNNLVPKWLNYSEMKLLEGKSYSYKHEHLWNIRVDACTTGYNWKDVYIYFARAEGDPSKVRIENIVYADAKINSYWVYDKQINAGPLVAKPIDYAEQLPLDFNGKMYWGYWDIRYLYQWNPIIKKYKSEILSKKIKLEGESKQGERINLDLWNYENKPEISDFEKGRIIDMNWRIHEWEFENWYLKKWKMTDTNWTIFEGEFKYWELNGTWKVIASDGTIYQGEFKDWELNGTWKAIDPDGTIYQGEFKDWELNGRGKITTPYGLIHEWEFKNRELNGKGKITVPDGTIYEGEFKNQLLDGEWSILKPDGHKEIGVFREWKLVEGNVIYPDR